MPAGTARQLKTNQVVYRRGDPSAEMYVVVKGRILLYPGDDPRRGTVIVGQGGYFGASALISDEPRAENAVAAEPSVILCIGRSQLGRLAKEHPAIATRILHDLERRIGAKKRAQGGAAEDDGVIRLKNTEPLSRLLFVKAIECPVCDAQFEVEVVRESRLAVDVREPDFRVRYRHIEPLWYRFSVCPQCLTAMKRNEFDKELPEVKKRALQDDVEERKSRFGVFDFSFPRDRPLAVTSVRLAERCYEVLGKSALERAAVALNLAWLYDDVNEQEEAAGARRRALDLYIYAYQRESIGDPKVVQRIAYLIGYLSYTLLRTQQAIMFINEALKIDRAGDPYVREMIRDFLPALRRQMAESEENRSPAVQSQRA